MSSYIKILSAFILIRKYGAKKPQVMLNFFPCVYTLSRNTKNIRNFFYLKFSFFGCKILSIFEQACFRNDCSNKRISKRETLKVTS